MKNKLIHIILIGFVLGSCEQLDSPKMEEVNDSGNFTVYLSQPQT